MLNSNYVLDFSKFYFIYFIYLFSKFISRNKSVYLIEEAYFLSYKGMYFDIIIYTFVYIIII